MLRGVGGGGAGSLAETSDKNSKSNIYVLLGGGRIKCKGSKEGIETQSSRSIGMPESGRVVQLDTVVGLRTVRLE